MAESWLPSLITDSPQAGYELAVRLSRLAVKLTQPDASVRERLRDGYANNFDSLIAISSVVAINFQTVAAANDYWRTSNSGEPQIGAL